MLPAHFCLKIDLYGHRRNTSNKSILWMRGKAASGTFNLHLYGSNKECTYWRPILDPSHHKSPVILHFVFWNVTIFQNSNECSKKHRIKAAQPRFMILLLNKLCDHACHLIWKNFSNDKDLKSPTQYNLSLKGFQYSI